MPDAIPALDLTFFTAEQEKTLLANLPALRARYQGTCLHHYTRPGTHENRLTAGQLAELDLGRQLPGTVHERLNALARKT